MEKNTSFYSSIRWVALVTAVILSIPLIAMQFTDEVKWSAGDFIIMGALIFSTGLSYVFLTQLASNFIHRAAVASAIGTTFLMIWANLAVGLIGSGPHAGNMMYIGVVGVVVIGTFLSRITAKGMELTMFASALTVILIAVVALATNMHQYADSSVAEILGVNAFFAILFSISGLLFRYVAMQSTTRQTDR